MSAPTTEAGRALLAAKHSALHAPLRGCVWPCSAEITIRDIEAEAAAKERERIRAAVEALPHSITQYDWSEPPKKLWEGVKRDEVLAAIEGASE